MKTEEEIFAGFKLNGILMLFVNFIAIGLLVFLFVKTVNNNNTIEVSVLAPLIILEVLTFFALNILWGGFMQIEPNEARVMVFFGKYSGTIKENGFFWVNPFYAKKKLTLRARNVDAEPIKVNDKSGNPIMIGLVIVWKVEDTYKASFYVDNSSMQTPVLGRPYVENVSDKMRAYEHFVKIQSYSALRNVAGLFAYDNNDSLEPNAITLRSGGDEINKLLEIQIGERLALAGIEVVEARINHLAYAPEIAAVMLRRQQADAIIAAREKIVEGAVGMVKMALDKLKNDSIIELDDEKKAAMVSNLLVVLCSDESAQPVLNTGTLYN